MAPWWATFVPAATGYVIGKSLALDTRTYLAREELANRFRGYLDTLAEAARQAEKLGDNPANPADLLELQIRLTADHALAAEFETVVVQAQGSSDKTLEAIPGAAELPLRALAGASWLAKYGAWIVGAVVLLILFYAWRAGSLAAGAKKVAAKAAEVVK